MLQVVEPQLCVSPLGVPPFYPQMFPGVLPGQGLLAELFGSTSSGVWQPGGKQAVPLPVSLDQFQLSGSGVLPGAAGGGGEHPCGNEDPSGSASAAGLDVAPCFPGAF